MIDYKIAIRSYKRHELVKKNTLKILQENKININRIYLFVANQEEFELYQKTCGDLVKEIIIGKLGGWQQTKFIQDYFSQGTPLFFMDDDLENFYEYEYRVERKNFRPKSLNLEKYILDGFETIQQLDMNTAFSFRGMTNMLYLKNKSWKEFRPDKCAGGFWGCFNDPLFEVLDYSHNDDAIRTANIINHCGGVINFNWASFKTSVGTIEGGMQSSGDRNTQQESRENFTKRICQEIYDTHDNIQKFYSPNFEFSTDKDRIWEVKIKTLTQIKKIKQFSHIKWEHYFEAI